jgi:acetyl-CoA synthetase
MEVAVMTPDGKRLGPGEKGILVLEKPFPSLTPTLWGEPERYAADYWGRSPGSTTRGTSPTSTPTATSGSAVARTR